MCVLSERAIAHGDLLLQAVPIGTSACVRRIRLLLIAMRKQPAMIDRSSTHPIDSLFNCFQAVSA